MSEPTPKRNQWQCPRCGRYGCPRRGDRLSAGWIVRYRQCLACQHAFKTTQAIAKDGRPVGREIVSG